MENIVAVLDLGTYEVRGAIGQRSVDGSLKLVAFESRKTEGIQRGNIINPDFVGSAIKEMTLALEKKLGKRIGKYYVNTGGMLIYQKQNKAYRHLGEQQEVDEVMIKNIMDENFKIAFDNGSEVIEVFADKYTIDDDFEVKNPLKYAGSKIEGDFLLSAVKKTGKQILERTLLKAGISNFELILTPWALGEAVLSEEEKEVGVVAIEVGAGKTSMIIYQDGVVKHVAVLPFGGEVVTKDLVAGCGIVFDKAEKMKVKFGSALADNQSENDYVSISGSEGWDPKEISCKTLAYIIQARMEEILANVMNQIEKSGLYDALGAGIVLCGGTAKLNGIVDLVKYKTGLDVRMGTGKRVIEETGDKFLDPSMAIVAGMLKLGTADCLKEEKVEMPQRSSNKRKSTHGVETPSLWGKFKDGLGGFFDEDDNAL